MVDSIDFKAGDTFDYQAEIPAAYLSALVGWAARAWVRDMGAGVFPPAQIDTLDCTLTEPAVSGDPYVLRIRKDGGETGTGLWPRPDDPRKTRRLICDVELYSDDATPIVRSISNFYIDVLFDPTRPA